MFGLFKKVIIEHSILGLLTRRCRRWDGKIEIQPNLLVELQLEGSRDAPYSDALAAALELPAKLPDLIPTISEHLLEHLQPYKDALFDPDDRLAEMFSDPSAVGKIKAIISAREAWAASRICGVDIGLADGKVQILLKIRSIWDEDHKLGAFFDDWQFTELGGSVV